MTPTEPTPSDTPPEPTPQPAAPQPAWKRNPVLTVAAVLGALILLCCCGGLVLLGGKDDASEPTKAETSKPPAAPAEPAAKPTTAAAPKPRPDSKIGGTCDMLLFTQGTTSEFAASIDVKNTGNIGIEVEVVAEFDQLGQDDYTLTELVKVKPGKTETVHLSELIDTSTVRRYQRGGYDCRISGGIVDTFGEVRQ